MPSVSGWALRQLQVEPGAHELLLRFYALDIGLGFATFNLLGSVAITLICFYALGIGWALRRARLCRALRIRGERFYALDIGLGFTTLQCATN